ncbi:MAG: hypothetical protein WBP96_08325, partial [Nitrososphaeraceae archaeon]
FNLYFYYFRCCVWANYDKQNRQFSKINLAYHILFNMARGLERWELKYMMYSKSFLATCKN